MRTEIARHLVASLRDRATASAELEPIFTILDGYQEEAGNLAIEAMNIIVIDNHLWKAEYHALYLLELRNINMTREAMGKSRIKGVSKSHLMKLLDHIFCTADSIDRIRLGLHVHKGFPTFTGDNAVFFKNLAERLYAELMEVSKACDAKKRPSSNTVHKVGSNARWQ